MFRRATKSKQNKAILYACSPDGRRPAKRKSRKNGPGLYNAFLGQLEGTVSDAFDALEPSDGLPDSKLPDTIQDRNPG